MANITNLPLPEQYRPEFEDHYDREYQQQIARTAGLCDSVAIMGEDREFPQLPKTVSVRKLTKRFETTAPKDITTGKRKLKTQAYISPIKFDRKDQMKFGTLESPIPGTIANQRAEIARNQDAVFVGKAGEVGGLLGKAIEVGENDLITYPDFDDAYTVPVNYAYGVTGGPNTGMSYDKIVSLRTQLGKLGVRSQDASTINPSPSALLIGYSQVEDLLHDPKIQNKDNASALLEQAAEGAIVDVLGYTVRVLDDDVLPISGGIRTCVAFCKSAVKFGYNEMPVHELDRLPDNTHTLQSVFYFDWGLARIWDQGVWKLPCAEA